MVAPTTNTPKLFGTACAYKFHRKSLELLLSHPKPFTSPQRLTHRLESLKMDPTPLPTIEPFIPAEYAIPQETINDGLLFLRETLASIKQDGAYGTIILYAANPAEKPVPTIMFGFPIPPKNLPAVRHPPLPILLLQDGVSPSGLTSLRPSWVNESVMHNKIQISNNSLGLQNNVEGGGSFGAG
ncbi:hypothetical protein L211DRAFT_871388 [Terfezia boudieri ATCC MYA-4762]|uniref:Uncharacterized protein n=1 Tax=Terfezia boudieri ATCC MYA-4762 TaxID=1051890 RepID=A0A3N4LCR2_9PEZI|nr:hypothetical protein L211DRAFT_871388 [Terfezia boudieri ATCC MYA-4762]